MLGARVRRLSYGSVLIMAVEGVPMLQEVADSQDTGQSVGTSRLESTGTNEGR